MALLIIKGMQVGTNSKEMFSCCVPLLVIKEMWVGTNSEEAFSN